METSINLYRRRFIPDELVLLKNDTILHMDDSFIITSWNTLKPRSDFASGLSAYFRKEGFKISRHYGKDGAFTRWYCDIIAETRVPDGLVFSDLLIDIIIYPDGTVHVADLDEAADALEQGLITPDMLIRALRSTDVLLTHIRKGTFAGLTECLSNYMK